MYQKNKKNKVQTKGLCSSLNNQSIFVFIHPMKINPSITLINVFLCMNKTFIFSLLRLETLLNFFFLFSFFLIPYLWLLMLQNGRCLFVKGAESLVHFDIHILAVMILKAAIKLTVTSRGARGRQHKASSSRAAPIAPGQDYSLNT